MKYKHSSINIYGVVETGEGRGGVGKSFNETPRDGFVLWRGYTITWYTRSKSGRVIPVLNFGGIIINIYYRVKRMTDIPWVKSPTFICGPRISITKQHVWVANGDDI